MKNFQLEEDESQEIQRQLRADKTKLHAATIDQNSTYKLFATNGVSFSVKTELILFSLTAGILVARVQYKRALAYFKQLDKNAKE